MIVEHLTFRLADGVSEEAFLAADRRVQTEFAPFQPGFVRRTTARGDGGSWLVETMWGSLGEADAAAAADADALADLRACVDPASTSVRRYQTLD